MRKFLVALSAVATLTFSLPVMVDTADAAYVTKRVVYHANGSVSRSRTVHTGYRPYRPFMAPRRACRTVERVTRGPRGVVKTTRRICS